MSDKETGRVGDREKRRLGDKESIDEKYKRELSINIMQEINNIFKE